jgi:hypothetical protein
MLLSASDTMCFNVRVQVGRDEPDQLPDLDVRKVSFTDQVVKVAL